MANCNQSFNESIRVILRHSTTHCIELNRRKSGHAGVGSTCPVSMSFCCHSMHLQFVFLNYDFQNATPSIISILPDHTFIVVPCDTPHKPLRMRLHRVARTTARSDTWWNTMARTTWRLRGTIPVALWPWNLEGKHMSKTPLLRNLSDLKLERTCRNAYKSYICSVAKPHRLYKIRLNDN